MRLYYAVVSGEALSFIDANLYRQGALNYSTDTQLHPPRPSKSHFLSISTN